MTEQDKYWGIQACRITNDGAVRVLPFSEGHLVDKPFSIKLVQSVNGNIQGSAVVPNGTRITQPYRKIEIVGENLTKTSYTHPFSLEAGRFISFKLGADEMIVRNNRPQSANENEVNSTDNSR